MEGFSKTAMLLVMIVCKALLCNAQSCPYRISGIVTDAQRHAVTGAVVLIATDTKKGAATDTAGAFVIGGVCRGPVSLLCNALGYKTAAINANVIGDYNELHIVLAVDSTQLHEVVINGNKEQREIQTATQVQMTAKQLFQTSGESLGEALKQLPGLNSVQTGPTLFKPVIHGLYSNRVLIINNGVRLEGQQWGTEHAPEIDQFSVNKISVIKGAASVRYGSDAIGGVVLLSPNELPTEKGISGNAYLVSESNSHTGITSAMLQGAFDKSLKGLSWRVQGTARETGNFKTPHYYLDNTGQKEGDFSASVGYARHHIKLNAYYSQYNTEVGIFSGAESGNLAELLAKFAEPRPLTPSYFSYTINRSYQDVHHEVLKTDAAYEFDNGNKLELTFARQNDIRKEYDADVAYNTNPAELNMPQLSFQLITHTLDLIYTQVMHRGFSGSFGLTGNTSGNIFEGIRYLIPNYRDYNGGAFAIEQYHLNGKITFEAGLRYDYRWMRVYRRDPTSLDLFNSTYTYSNASGTVGVLYRYNDHLDLRVNTGTAWRAPNISEMYINGVHFSDASYEVGDSALKSERALNTGMSINYVSDKLHATVDLYYNHIQNYIYEIPGTPVTTISGTYPTFYYTQDNVNIKGLDAIIQYDFLPRFTLQSKTTLVRGFNEGTDNYLIYMPADKFVNGIEYHPGKIGKLQATYVAFENERVLRQTRAPANLDYVPPPPGYSLFNANVGCTLPLGKNKLDMNLAVRNMTNTAYRDYLDHFRYYVDELGANYVLRLRYSF